MVPCHAQASEHLELAQVCQHGCEEADVGQPVDACMESGLLSFFVQVGGIEELKWQAQAGDLVAPSRRRRSG